MLLLTVFAENRLRLSCKSICVAFWLLVAGMPSAQAQGPIADSVDLLAFVRDGCPHCQEAEQFLALLQREQPDLRISVRNIQQDSAAFAELKQLIESQNGGQVRLPTFWVRGQLLVGFSPALGSDEMIRGALRAVSSQPQTALDAEGSCEVQTSDSCEAPLSPAVAAPPEVFTLHLFGWDIGLDEVGLPIFTLVMGLLDGFNPCSIWVLLLMISMLVPMQNRPRMLAVGGTFVLVEGLAYFVFMAAWLNLFLLIGLSRASELAIACLALLAGAINLKDFWAFGVGVSLSIPTDSKPAIYQRMRRILQAENLAGAILGAIVLALLVQIVELLCTSGFPALYTRILTLRELSGLSYYSYLLLYNLAYMLDDIVVLGLGIATLSQRRLQEKEGRWLKLLSGLVMVTLGLYLILQDLIK